MGKMHVNSLEGSGIIRQQVYQTVSHVTGHRVEDLENELFLEDDLGLDSIKMISLMNELMELIPADQLDDFNAAHPVGNLLIIETVGELAAIFEEWEAALQLEVALSRGNNAATIYAQGSSGKEAAAAEPAFPAKEDLARLTGDVYALISEITGHKPEDLQADLDLESDLGLDSIKMISLMNGMLELIPADQAAEFSEKYSFAFLMSLQTIGDIVDVFADWRRKFGADPSPGISSDTAALADISENEPEFLEMLHTQYLFLVTYLSVANLSISTGVTVRGEFNASSLWQSWRELVYRHPILRSVFVPDEENGSLKGYRLKLLRNVVLPEIPVQDIRYMDKQEQRQTINQRFEAALNSKFEITKWPMHALSVIRTADDEYELILDINHLISDGLGNQQIMQELLEIYGAKSQQRNAGLRPALTAKEYNAAVSELNAWNSPEETRALDEYVQQQGRGTYFFNPYGSSRPFAAERSPGAWIRSRKYWIDKDTTSLLMTRTKLWRTSLFTLLVSAYLKTIKQQAEMQNHIILNLPTSGKLYPHTDATGMLGAFAQNLALSFTCDDPTESWQSLVRRTKETISGKLTSGIDRAQTSRAAHYAKETIHLQNGVMPDAVASMIRSTLKSNLYLSFVGNTPLDKQYGLYEISDYEAYTGTNPGAIDNLIELHQGRLLITSNYDSSFFDDAYMEQHMERFISNIDQLAAFEPALEALEAKAASIPWPAVPETGQKRAGAPPLHANAEIETLLIGFAGVICARELHAGDLSKDLESELGMDSLQLIRLIARLGNHFGHLDKASLFESRTLNEMLTAILAHENGTGEQADKQAAKQADAADIPYIKIAEQCKATPDALAILDGQQAVTYRELDRNSNRLARYLRSQGVKSQTLVGIMTSPGPLMLIGILGILKAGAAYVPLDPAYPSERLRYIAGHAELEILLTEQTLKEQAEHIAQDGPLVRSLIVLDGEEPAEPLYPRPQGEPARWRDCPDSDLAFDSSPHDVMVVLYTSGSTGKPKGVVLNHRGYMNRLNWHQETFRLKPGERVAQKTSCCFDISVWELLWPLMYGGTVCPAKREVVKNPWSLARWMIDTHINIMHFVPSLFGEFVNSLEGEPYVFPELRWLIFSGEGLPLSPVQRWMDRYGSSTGLANLYGPTEASIDVTCHIISERPGARGELSIPIGKPITGAFIKTLDEHMREVPAGEIGELWIGGIQLAKGYLHDPEKTRAAFHPNPFPEIPGEFIYRTGDLTAKQADGSYEYHGRIDNQVKLRGFRVELGEIEAVLGTHPDVDEAAVIVIEHSPEQQIMLACLAGRGTGEEEKELKEFIGQKLPYYMIPHRLEWLPRLPKNPNGKLDRKALRDRFGLPVQAGEGLSAKFPLSQGYASAERNSTDADTPAMGGTYREAELSDSLPLAPAQSWLVNYFDYPHCWAGYTRFLYKQPLDLQRFKQAAALLNRRHDALRSVLVQKGAGWEQRFLAEETEGNIDFYDGSHMKEDERDQEIQALLTAAIQAFQVDRWPLWRIIVIQISESLYEIAAVGHHLISDVITNQLLLQEIWQIYNGPEAAGNALELPQPKHFADFVRTVQEEKRNRGEDLVRYWSGQFPPESVCKLPGDFFKGPNDEQSARMVRFEFDKETTSAILGKAKKHFGSSVYPILLAPLYRMLENLFGSSKVIVSHRVHGRDLGGGKSFMQTPGDFAVNFPMGIELNKDGDWLELVKHIRQGLDEVPLGGVSYDLVAESLPNYMYPDLKLTPVRANYLGNRDALKMPGFEFSREGLDRRFSLPRQKRISVIEFFFSVEEGKLTVEIEYSANLHADSTIERMAGLYRENMGKLISSTLQTPAKPGPGRIREGQLAGKVAVVTGGSKGIGRSIALAMAREGADLVLVSRSERKLQETAEEIRSLGADVLTIAADVGETSSAELTVNRALEHFGHIDILVNSAGITGMAAMADMTPATWEAIVQVNLMGTYYFCHAVIPHLVRQQQGKIINIGSDSSFIGYPMMSAYAASKHGVLGLTRALSEELKNSNIQVNALCPALVDTDMAPAAFKGRAIPPSGVADSAVFLASSRSDYITGEALQVYGKQDMNWFGAQQMQMLQAVMRK